MRVQRAIHVVLHQELCAHHLTHFNSAQTVKIAQTPTFEQMCFKMYSISSFVTEISELNYSGVAYGMTFTCPSLTACSNTPDICTSPSIAVDCAPICGTCSVDGRFACINSTSFALCFGGATPSSIIGTCAANEFCDITVSAPPFCTTDATVNYLLFLFWKTR